MIREFGRNLFGSLLIEFIVVLVAILVKEDKRKVAAVLAVGTLVAGIIGFGPQIIQYTGASSPSSTPSFVLPTAPVAETSSSLNMRLVFYGYPERGKPKTGMALITRSGLSDIHDVPFLRAGGELSPNGSLIVYDCGPHPKRGLYIVDAEGNNARMLQALSTGYCVSPRWSPDGSKVSYANAEDGSFHIVDVISGVDTIIRNFDGGDWHWWSPSGNEIVYEKSSSDKGVARLLYISDLKGNSRQLTSANSVKACPQEIQMHAIDTWAPAWSPDGRSIAFTHCDRLYTISPDGTNLRELASNNVYSPRWSPDGNWIFYIGTGDSLFRISKEGNTPVAFGKLPYGGGPFSIAPFK